eukprot:1928211-Rhodomonas_salina.1
MTKPASLLLLMLGCSIGGHTLFVEGFRPVALPSQCPGSHFPAAARVKTFSLCQGKCPLSRTKPFPQVGSQIESRTVSRSTLARRRNVELHAAPAAAAAAAAATGTKLGFFGHTGLLTLSIILVTLFRRLLAGRPLFAAPKPPEGGIMGRCPWPFIFFHDFKQGLRDFPTWVTV